MIILEPSLFKTALVAGTTGVVAHIAYFIHGEHLIRAPRYLLAAILVPSLTTCLLVLGCNLSLHSALQLVVTAVVAFYAALLSSIAVYRLLLHPLHHFPGPSGARLTQFWLVAQISEQVDLALVLDRLHAQYGEYVRVGPNLLSVSDPDAAQIVHGSQTTFDKSDWYSIGKPTTTLHQMRDKTEHARRRRHGWDKAFTSKALRAYDSRLVKYSDMLVEQLSNRSGKIVNLTDWTRWWAWDIMGELAFGRPFNTLAKAQSHFYLDAMRKGGVVNGKLNSVPWLMHMMVSLVPMCLNPISRLLSYAQQCVDNRRNTEPSEKDVMSHLLEAGPFFGSPQFADTYGTNNPMANDKLDELLLTGDAGLLIVAGSDTTASALLPLLYHLTRQPELVTTLRRILVEEHGLAHAGDVTVASVQNIAYMNALINETLRLHPPVPSGQYRQTGAEGAVLDGKQVPAGVKVLTPAWSVQRSSRAFVQPEAFIPERWTTRPELILNKNGFIAFSMGKFACLGKQLAYNELRTVVAKLVLDLDFAFAPRVDNGREDLLELAQDTFSTTHDGKFEVVVTKRIWCSDNHGVQDQN